MYQNIRSSHRSSIRIVYNILFPVKILIFLPFQIGSDSPVERDDIDQLVRKFYIHTPQWHSCVLCGSRAAVRRKKETVTWNSRIVALVLTME